MTKRGKTLLLGGREDKTWTEIVRIAVDDLNKELAVSTEMLIDYLPWDEYDLVILDAGARNDIEKVVARVHERNSAARIIVFSPSPRWEQAREALLAGAVDYAPKELQPAQVLSVIRRGLSKQVRETRKRD
jgi:DNA-binding NtrC family response regulator